MWDIENQETGAKKQKGSEERLVIRISLFNTLCCLNMIRLKIITVFWGVCSKKLTIDPTCGALYAIHLTGKMILNSLQPPSDMTEVFHIFLMRKLMLRKSKLLTLGNTPNKLTPPRFICLQSPGFYHPPLSHMQVLWRFDCANCRAGDVRNECTLFS